VTTTPPENLLPWPAGVISASRWAGVARLLERCRQLAEAGVLPHTIMVVGPRGLGREGLAVELAASLICPTGGNACSCSSCQRVRRGIHPDLQVVVVNREKKEPVIKIDPVRDILGTLDRLPYEGRRRVVLFESCQTPPLNTEAASALLKTLEEPPPYVTFVMLAANPRRVLPTIASRSVEVRVPSPSREELVATVAELCRCDPSQAAKALDSMWGNADLVLKDALDGASSETEESDPGQAAEFLAESVETAAALAEILPRALGGDDLALLGPAHLAKNHPAGIELTVATLLGLTIENGGEGERFLTAAATLLEAERRRRALNLDFEAAFTNAMFVAAAETSS
jgi:DNA polymerase-3 subunit delta'